MILSGSVSGLQSISTTVLLHAIIESRCVSRVLLFSMLYLNKSQLRLSGVLMSVSVSLLGYTHPPRVADKS